MMKDKKQKSLGGPGLSSWQQRELGVLGKGEQVW